MKTSKEYTNCLFVEEEGLNSFNTDPRIRQPVSSSSEACRSRLRLIFSVKIGKNVAGMVNGKSVGIVKEYYQNKVVDQKSGLVIKDKGH